MSNRILIFGSCVTRDIFNFQSSNILSFVDIYARSSIISVCSKKFDVEIDLSRNSSAFQRRMIEYDFKKSFLERIKIKDFDAIVFDFIDARFRIYEFTEGCYITYSNELIETKTIMPSAERLSWFDSDGYRKNFEDSIKFINNYIKENAPDVQVILNKVYWACSDNQGGRLDQKQYPDHFLEKHNNHLSWIYEKFEFYFDNASVIEYPKQLLKTLKDHRWGAAPFHYHDCLYEYTIKMISNILSRNKKRKSAVISVDVETLPGRTSEKNMSSNLIWGKNQEGATGVVGIINLFNKHNIKGTFFVDPFSIEDFDSVVNYIENNQMELCIHAHVERSQWGVLNRIKSFAGIPLGKQDDFISYADTVFSTTSSKYSKIFRAGSLALDSNTYVALMRNSMSSSNVFACPFTQKEIFNLLPDSLLFDNDVVDFPVSICLDSLAKLEYSDWKLILQSCMSDTKRSTHIFLMHNWSLTPRDKDGRHDTLDLSYITNFERIISFITENFDVDILGKKISELQKNQMFLPMSKVNYSTTNRVVIDKDYLNDYSHFNLLDREFVLSNSPYYFSVELIPESFQRIYISHEKDLDIRILCKFIFDDEFRDVEHVSSLQPLSIIIKRNSQSSEILINAEQHIKSSEIFFRLSIDASLTSNSIYSIDVRKHERISSLIRYRPYNELPSFSPFSYKFENFNCPPEIGEINPIIYPLKYNEHQSLHSVVIDGAPRIYFIKSGSKIHLQLQRQMILKNADKDFLLSIIFSEFSDVSQIVINNSFVFCGGHPWAIVDKSKSSYYLQLPLDVDEYINEKLSRSMYSDYRRFLRKCAKDLDDFKYVIFVGNDISFEILQQATAVVDLRMSDKNDNYTSIFTADWVHSALELYRKFGVIFCYYAGGEMIAALMVLRYNGELHYMNSGFRPDYAAYRLSKSLLIDMVFYAISEKIKGVNLGGGDFGVKTRLGAVEYYLYNNLVQRGLAVKDYNADSLSPRSVCLSVSKGSLRNLLNSLSLRQSEFAERYKALEEFGSVYLSRAPIFSASSLAVSTILSSGIRIDGVIDFSSDFCINALVSHLLGISNFYSVYKNDDYLQVANDFSKFFGQLENKPILYENLPNFVQSCSVNLIVIYNPGGVGIISNIIELVKTLRDKRGDDVYILYFNDVHRDTFVRAGFSVSIDFVPKSDRWRFGDRTSLLKI